ncbi:hypothetical protein OH491_07325 [Termitidicoccus mucosus]|uniref:hypothetical protein n=1 Tax=Termitidicoccus mucosus TaxID=1184151 RepID=UPI003183E3DF
MKNLTLGTIVIFIGVSLFLSGSCRQQQQYDPDFPKGVKEIALIWDEAIKTLSSEKDISKAESSLINTISRITKIKDEHKRMAGVDNIGGQALFFCYYSLAYIYKCQGNESAYRLVNARYMDENPTLPSEMLQGRTRQQNFEYHVMAYAGSKNTVWNELDGRLQNEVHEKNLREDVQYFAEKLGISISLKGGLEDFRADLEAAIMRAGLENVVAKAKAAESWQAGQHFFRILEDQYCIRIESYGRLKRTIGLFSLYIDKNSDGKLTSCSFSIKDLPVEYQQMLSPSQRAD